MRRTLILLAALWAVPAHGAEISTAPVTDIHHLIGETLPASTEYLKLTVFPERLVYDVRWGIIGVGHATMVAEKLIDFAGRPAYAIVSEAISNSFCDTFYKVRDLNESWIDARRLTSLGYSKKLREGKFFRDEWVLFNDTALTFHSRTIGRDGNFSVREGTIPVTVQDILSSLYFIRSHDLIEGSEITLDVNTRENWPLVVRVIKRETVKTPAGKFKAVLVEPAIRKEGIFIQKGKKMRVWLSDDERKMPVLIKVEVFFGHITIALSEFSPQ